jgi:DNA-binding MarR family transcriptional regulator/N-acetylglutamate synthase-like GNAT family acetyltransferase
MPEPAAALRSFNRFYTKKIGLLNEHLGESPFSLAEARVLFELAHGSADTAADLSRLLGIDKGYLSRILTRLRNEGLISSRISPKHARHRLLSLTDQGIATYASLERAAIGQIEDWLAPLGAAEVGRLIAATKEIQQILVRDPTPAPYRLRPPAIGDLGWVIHRQALLYHREYGWDWGYEGLIAGIVHGFVSNFEQDREQCWIAERDGEAVGAVFLVDSGQIAIGQLRLLHVEPSARGSGIGSALVAACIARAREVGYRQLMLWTNDVLVSARRIYQNAGFVLTAEERHQSFGHDLVGQTWILDLMEVT